MEYSGDERTELEKELIDRERGMLTKADREFLWDFTDPNENTRIQRRYQIRQRVTNALRDFTFLHAMREEDVKLIFEDYFNPESSDDTLEPAVIFTIEWIYFALGREEFLRQVENIIEWDDRISSDGTVVAKAEIDLNIEHMEVDYDAGWRDYDGPEDPELTDATVDTLFELERRSDNGIKKEKVVEAVVERHDVSEAEAEQAIQDALFTGQCYEPEEGLLVSI